MRWRPGLYARPDAGLKLHHSGRGPEHQPGADENVPDPAGLRLKIVITGDVTQIDLPDGKPPACGRPAGAEKVEGIGICELTNADVVRHVMVQRIVKAYEEYETAKNGGKGKK